MTQTPGWWLLSPNTAGPSQLDPSIQRHENSGCAMFTPPFSQLVISASRHLQLQRNIWCMFLELFPLSALFKVTAALKFSHKSNLSDLVLLSAADIFPQWVSLNLAGQRELTPNIYCIGKEINKCMFKLSWGNRSSFVDEYYLSFSFLSGSFPLAGVRRAWFLRILCWIQHFNNPRRSRSRVRSWSYVFYICKMWSTSHFTLFVLWFYFFF